MKENDIAMTNEEIEILGKLAVIGIGACCLTGAFLGGLIPIGIAKLRRIISNRKEEKLGE